MRIGIRGDSKYFLSPLIEVLTTSDLDNEVS